MSAFDVYRVYCIEEGKFVTVPSFTEPILCPNDHPNRSIDQTKTSIVQIGKVTDNITVQEPSRGIFQTESIPIIIPASEPGTVFEFDFEWPMDILIWKTEFSPNEDMVEDMVTLIVNPEYSIGNLSLDGIAGDTVLHVTPETIQNVIRGIDILIDDGIKQNDVNRIAQINDQDNTIRVQIPLTDNFYVNNNNVELKYQNCIVRKFFIPQSLNTISFGDKGFRGKELPANTTSRVKYYNNNGLAKRWYWIIQFYIIG